MHTMIVRDIADILQVSPEQVFRMAFEWSEVRKNRKYITDQFLNWFYDGKIHPVVEDFVIDVLARRVK